MDTIKYFEDYRTLKAHFNSNRFIYGRDTLPIPFLWNREPEKRQLYFSHFREKYTFAYFHDLLIASFVNNPKIYFTDLEKEENLLNYKKYKIWWSSPIYYFKKDLENIINETEDEIRIETFILLDKYFDLNSDWYQENQMLYDKYYYLFSAYANIIVIKTDEDIKNLVNQITGEK
jgi:hypothetical protein